MPVAYRGGGGRAELQRQHWKERGTSPERTMVWTEPKSSMEKKVEVVYYLTGNDGHLEHPHFMELSLPSGQPLYLRDVMRRLNSLRGAGMASTYSWSCKRIYKNGGFVWQDLAPDDFIYPAHGHDYVLKGSHLLLCPLPSHKPLMEDSNPHNGREYRVYRSPGGPTVESHMRSVDVGTQTDQGRKPREEETEISISPPPPSSASNETTEGGDADEDEDQAAAGSGKTRAPAAVLVHLFSCGSISMKGQGTASVASHLRRGRPVATSRVNSNTTSYEGDVKENYSFSETGRLEEMEYFSGSLIEMKKNKGSNGSGEAHPGLRRSASYNADRSLKLELAKEMDGVRARCIPRKHKAMVAARAAKGSKGITDDQ